MLGINSRQSLQLENERVGLNLIRLRRGWSLYSQPRAYEVSFNRPYARYSGSGDLFYWEYNTVRFLEREGYDVTYSTDVDTHANGQLLLRHHAFLSVGHDEYWSWQMRDHVEDARDKGVSLGFFGADTSYWQIRFAQSKFTGDPNRTIICYKDAALDPMSETPGSTNLTTVPFRISPVDRPEDMMVGEMYPSPSPETQGIVDMVVTDASNWIFADTGLKNGDHLTGLLGYEADQLYKDAPEGTISIAHSPYQDIAGNLWYADMTVYLTGSKSTVVDIGSMNWNRGLDGFTLGHPVLTNPAAQQATRNILRRFGATDPASISVPTSADQILCTSWRGILSRNCVLGGLSANRNFDGFSPRINARASNWVHAQIGPLRNSRAPLFNRFPTKINTSAPKARQAAY